MTVLPNEPILHNVFFHKKKIRKPQYFKTLMQTYAEII